MLPGRSFEVLLHHRLGNVDDALACLEESAQLFGGEHAVVDAVEVLVRIERDDREAAKEAFQRMNLLPRKGGWRRTSAHFMIHGPRLFDQAGETWRDYRWTADATATFSDSRFPSGLPHGVSFSV